MRDAEIHAAIADAIERFANRVADELTKQAAMAILPASDAALVRAAWAIREAGKSNRTRRREAEKGNTP